MIFIDTNIAIGLRDVDHDIHRRIGRLERAPVISVITRIELENGVNREPAEADRRRRLLDRLLETLPVEMFSPADILVYGEIVLELGYSRRLTLDRLIAAQAVARDALLVTRNGSDFRGIPRLRLEVWSSTG